MAGEDDPVVVFKKSRTKSNRIRTDSQDNLIPKAGDDQQDEREDSPSAVAASIKNRHKARLKPKTKSRLSFGADEDEGEKNEVFQVKKSTLSQKLKSGGGKAAPGVALPSNLDQASITPQGSPLYSKEYLSELKASTPSTPSKSNHGAVSVQESDLSLDASELAGAVIEDLDDIDQQQTYIPSESSIAVAKEKRNRLRTTQVQNGEDFISLAVSKRADVPSGPHPESRLMREDDELGEGDDEYAEYTAAQERIALGKKSRKKEAAKRKENIREMIEEAVEEDEETREWEEEQLRRVGRMDTEPEKKPIKQTYKPAPIPPPASVPTLDGAISRLGKALTDLTNSHAGSTSALVSLADERAALEEKEKQMREMVLAAEKKRSWFVAFRDWVESVTAFLDEKYPQLEKLEDERVSLLKERKDMITKRRTQDDEDDLSLFLGQLPEQHSDEPEEVDDMGRVIPRQNFAVLRRERQSQRASRRAKRPPAQEEEGYSTDSSLPPSDAADYTSAIAVLEGKVKDVLKDVKAADFRDPMNGLGKWFGEWRDRYSDTYTGAFGGLGMVSAWEFWVRLEMVGWDPVEDDRTLDTFSWYTSLYTYSRPTRRAQDDDKDMDEPDLGPDGDLVSAMLSTAVIPRLCKLIQGGAFDVYSAKHVKRLVDLAEQVEASVTREKFELLLKSVILCFREAVTSTDELVQRYVDRNNTMFNPDGIPARRRFLTRWLKFLRNLLRWRKYSGELFGVNELVAKVIEDCMMPVALTGWDVGGKEIMQKVHDSLPRELRTADLQARLTQ